jgi:hypothetical protein
VVQLPQHPHLSREQKALKELAAEQHVDPLADYGRLLAFTQRAVLNPASVPEHARTLIGTIPLPQTFVDAPASAPVSPIATSPIADSQTPGDVAMKTEQQEALVESLLASVASASSSALEAVPGIPRPEAHHSYTESWVEDRFVDNESFCALCGDGGEMICCEVRSISKPPLATSRRL